jgi:hypothetical protein
MRMDGQRISTPHGSGLLAALLTLVLLSIVPETLASGDLRAEAQNKTRGVAATASTVPGDDGAKVRHLVGEGETSRASTASTGCPRPR